MLASTGYWMRLLGAVLFLVSVTLDGVDGELARLRMVESEAGAKLDVLTDNIVHVAIFIGLTIGCYRSESQLRLLLPAGDSAGRLRPVRNFGQPRAEADRRTCPEWIGKVERVTGRDFAYLLVVLALFDWLPAFVWGAAFGTWVFALSLWWLTNRRQDAVLRRGC